MQGVAGGGTSKQQPLNDITETVFLLSRRRNIKCQMEQKVHRQEVTHS